MKIVFLADDFPPISFGGAGISTYELALGMKHASHDVFVITTCRNENEAGTTEYDGLTVFKIASDYPERWRAWRSLYNPPVVRQVEKILKEIRPDVVHANNIHYHLSYHCLMVAKRYAKAVVWTARDAMAFSYGKLRTEKYFERLDAHLTWLDNVRQAGRRYNPFRNLFIHRYLRCVDARFAVSEALKRALNENGIDDVEVSHTGINVQEWEATRAELETCRERYGLKDKRVVLFGGRLGAGTQVVQAAAILKEEIRDAALVVMGRDEDAKHMKDDSRPAEVTFTGWLAGREKVAMYAVSDIVWVPSTYFDAFPRSALEASATGKPVIVSKFGGAAELVQDGVTGYVVDPRNPRGIADKTIDLLRHPEEAEAFGRAGRERVSADFNRDAQIGRLVARYRELAERNAARVS